MAATEEEAMEDMVVEATALIAVEDMEDTADTEDMEVEDTTEDIGHGPGPHTTITDTMDMDHGDLPTARMNFLFMKEVTSVPTSR